MYNSSVTNGTPSRVFVVPQQQPAFLASTVRTSAPGSPVKQFGIQNSNDEEENPIPEEEIKSDKRMMNLFILLLPFILAVLFFIAALRLINTSLNTQKSLEGADNVLNFVHRNLNSNPVNAWKTTKSSSCPNDFEESDIGKWQGIDRGCLCQNGNTYARKSFDECLDLTDSNCSYEYGEYSEDYSRWVDEKVQFCDSTVSGGEWLKVAHCDTSKNTYCGASVCVKGVNAECPPNTMQVSQLKNPSQSFENLLSNFGNENISNESNVVVRQASEDGKSPAVEISLFHDSKVDPVKNTAFVWLEIAQGNNLCLNSDYAETNNVIYHLDSQQSQNKVCDQYGALKSHQVVVVDTAFQSLINKNNGLFDVYSSSNLVDYDPKDYASNTNTLLAVKKIAVQNSKECDSVFDDHIGDSAYLARYSRSVLRVFSWILFGLAIASVILGIVFIAAALSPKVSTQHSTKVKVARIYWFSAWVLVGMAFLIFLYYHIFLTLWLGENEDKLRDMRDKNCFEQNPGINVAIGKLISFDEETNSTFGPLVNEMFGYGLIYSLVWMGIIAFWKNKYPDVQNFINHTQ